jgi:predicted 2-oxoglutarate/Fe(II)-dependent dioxygenase YbiX
MKPQKPPLVQAGDRLPLWYGTAADFSFYSSETQAGRPAAVILAHGNALRDLPPVIDQFALQADAFADRGADVLVLGNDDVVRALRGSLAASPFIKTIDGGTGLFALCSGGADVTVLVVDRNRRLALRLSAGPPAEIVAACLRSLDDLPREAPRDVALPAPVLMLSNLLSRPMCQTLIERFESGTSIDGEVASIDSAGTPLNRVDHAKKCRRDLLIPQGDKLHEILHDALLGRCAPEIAKAFGPKVTKLDRILVARYDVFGGWFRRHRDNAAQAVAFREFAISVNLNTEEYQGGHLFFPEYNDHRYRPHTGAGLIFSASLLHEAAPVTRGRRYVLLTFFYGAGATPRPRGSVPPPVKACRN